MSTKIDVINLMDDDDDENEKKCQASERNTDKSKQAATVSTEPTTCMICLEPVDNSGPHRVVALRCGHLFGKDCIKEWLTKGHGNKQRCPKCNKAAKVNHLVELYDSVVVATGSTAQVLELEAKLAAEQRERQRVEQERVRSAQENQRICQERAKAEQEAERARRELEQLRQQLQQQQQQQQPQGAWSAQSHQEYGPSYNGWGQTGPSHSSHTVTPPPQSHQWQSRQGQAQHRPQTQYGQGSWHSQQAQYSSWQTPQNNWRGGQGQGQHGTWTMPASPWQPGVSLAQSPPCQQPQSISTTSTWIPATAAAGAVTAASASRLLAPLAWPCRAGTRPAAHPQQPQPRFDLLQTLNLSGGRCFDVNVASGVLVASEGKRLLRTSLLHITQPTYFSLPPGASSLKEIKFSPNGRYIAIACVPCGLVLLAAASGAVAGTYGIAGGAWSCAWGTKKEHEVYVGMKGGQVGVVDTLGAPGANSVRVLATLPTPAPVFSVLPLPLPSPHSNSGGGRGSEGGASHAGSADGSNDTSDRDAVAGGVGGGKWNWAGCSSVTPAPGPPASGACHGGPSPASTSAPSPSGSAPPAQPEGGSQDGQDDGCVLEVLASSPTGAWAVGRDCVRPLASADVAQEGQGGCRARHTCESIALDAESGAIAVSWRTPLELSWRPDSAAQGTGAYHSLFVCAGSRQGATGVEGAGASDSASAGNGSGRQQRVQEAPLEAIWSLRGHTSHEVMTRGCFMHHPTPHTASSAASDTAAGGPGHSAPSATSGGGGSADAAPPARQQYGLAPMFLQPEEQQQQQEGGSQQQQQEGGSQQQQQQQNQPDQSHHQQPPARNLVSVPGHASGQDSGQQQRTGAPDTAGTFFVSADEWTGTVFVWCVCSGAIVARLPHSVEQQHRHQQARDAAVALQDRVLLCQSYAGVKGPHGVGSIVVVGSEREVRVYRVSW